jgi:hypothetical protein
VHGAATGPGPKRRPTGCGLFRSRREDFADESFAEEDLKREVKDQQRRWQYRVHRGRVWFDKELRETHRRLRQSIPAYILEGNLLSLLTAPIIYSLLLPLVLLDLWVTLYQSICFPIYGMPRCR